MAKKQKVSRELAELLAAYGDPPQYPHYHGDWLHYRRAVELFEKLTSTPEAKARRAAMERYFNSRDRVPPGAITEDESSTG